MRLRLLGLGYLLGWPVVEVHRGGVGDARVRAWAILRDHPDCECVEIFEDERFVEAIDATSAGQEAGRCGAGRRRARATWPDA